MTSVRRVPRTLGVATIMRKATKMTAFRNRVELSVTPLECRRLLSISASYIGQAPPNEGGALHDTVSFTTGLVSDGIADYCITVTGLANKTIQYWVVSQEGGGIYSTGGSLPLGVNQGWAADLQHVGSDVNLYFEPTVANTVNTAYDVTIGYTDGTSDVLYGVKPDQNHLFNPGLRMTGAAVQVSWNGQQEGVDLTGPDPGVGPDGIVDDEVTLSNLSAFQINYVTITGPVGSGLAWESNLNPDGFAHAEMVRATNNSGSTGGGSPNPQNSTTAKVYFDPYVITRDGTRVNLLNTQSLTVTVHYNIFNNDEPDTFSNLSLGGAKTNPKLAVPPAPAPPTLDSVSGVQVTWKGQDGQNLTGSQGDVHIALTGLPSGKTMTGVELSDPARSSWTLSNGLAYQQSSPSDSTTADVDFQPTRDEAGAAMVLRITYSDGSMAVIPFTGGSCDVGKRLMDTRPSGKTVVVDNNATDLITAVADPTVGTVELSTSISLSGPLILNHPITITPAPGLGSMPFLTFSQGDPIKFRATAIIINSGHVTLSGFGVNFSGTFNWSYDGNVNFGPAVIGTATNFDNINYPSTWPPTNTPLVDINILNMNISAPTIPDSQFSQANPVAAPNLIRLYSALSGQVSNNFLKGGDVFVQNGPWTISGNQYHGTQPGTYSPQVFGMWWSHDVVLSGNTAQSDGDPNANPYNPNSLSGRTWRFLVENYAGYNNQILNNTSIDLGPRDSDVNYGPSGQNELVGANSSENVLTESFSVHFEGLPLAVSDGGLILQIPQPQNGAANTGDVVSILSGQFAGQWYMVAQQINPTTYLMQKPLPSGRYKISISNAGYVNQTFQGNTIDTQGGENAPQPPADLVLVGNTFGAQIINNQFLGGGIYLEAAPTNDPSSPPYIWGWSHAPFMGALIQGNVFEDSNMSGHTVPSFIGVDHSAYINTSWGRTYMSATIAGNVFKWSNAPVNPNLGQPGYTTTAYPWIDPNELRLTIPMTGNVNKGQGPSGSTASVALQVSAANVNGTAVSNQQIVLQNVSSNTVYSAAVQPAGLLSQPETLAQPVNNTGPPDVRGRLTGGPRTGIRVTSGQSSGKKGRLVSGNGWGGALSPSRPGLKWWRPTPLSGGERPRTSWSLS